MPVNPVLGRQSKEDCQTVLGQPGLQGKSFSEKAKAKQTHTHTHTKTQGVTQTHEEIDMVGISARSLWGPSTKGYLEKGGIWRGWHSGVGHVLGRECVLVSSMSAVYLWQHPGQRRPTRKLQ